MSEPNLVPYTPILSLRHEIESLDDEPKLRRAEEITAGNGAEVVEAFCRSVEILSERYAGELPFRDKPRTPTPTEHPFPVKGPDLAWFMHRQQRLEIDEHPELAVGYADYELSLLRTLDNATFDLPRSGKKQRPNNPAGRAVLPDLVLVNAEERTPVMGEVKMGRDESFSGLIQLLTYIAHAASPSQYKRLRAYLASAGYPDADPARFDGYLLIHRYGQRWKDGQFEDTNNTYLDDLVGQTDLLLEQLMAAPEITRQIRRLARIELRFEDEQLRGTLRWPR